MTTLLSKQETKVLLVEAFFVRERGAKIDVIQPYKGHLFFSREARRVDDFCHCGSEDDVVLRQLPERRDVQQGTATLL